jgi:hypothetical protein
MQSRTLSSITGALIGKQLRESRLKTILLCIDGTGVLLTSQYQQENRNSFVSYIARHSRAELKMYLRGPGNEGLDMPIIAAKGYQYVHLAKIANPTARVLLAGWSRGGAAVIDVATRLARDNVTVDGMMLFDPVLRSPWSAIGAAVGENIPTNVLRVVQARRNRESFSRNSFGNCANRWHHPTRCEIKEFWSTHGGVGGVPSKPKPGESRTQFINEGLPEARPTFVTFDQDLEGARQVWHWSQPRLQSMGFLIGRH